MSNTSKESSCILLVACIIFLLLWLLGMLAKVSVLAPLEKKKLKQFFWGVTLKFEHLKTFKLCLVPRKFEKKCKGKKIKGKIEGKKK